MRTIILIIKNYSFDELLIEFIKIIPTTIVGIITLYIVFRQYYFDKQRLRHDLYNKQLGVFKIVNKMFFLLVASSQIDGKILNDIMFASQDRFFVFSESLNNQITAFFMQVWEVAELQQNKKMKEANLLAKEISSLQHVIEDQIKKEMSIKKV